MNCLLRVLHFRAVVATMFVLAASAAAAPGSTSSLNDNKTGHAPVALAGFVENRGHVFDTDGANRSDVLYTAGGGAMRVFFATNRISYVFAKLEDVTQPQARDLTSTRNTPVIQGGIYRVDLELIGANPSPAVHGTDPLPESIRYYIGGSVSETRSFRTLVYSEVYPGIDLVFRMLDDGIKYEFIVHPGGRVADIRMRYIGSDGVALETDGSLRITSPLGQLREAAPFTYQSSAPDLSFSAGMPEVRSAFALDLDNGEIAFSAGTYDASRPLVIDPTVQWATFYGGSNVDRGSGITSDPSGNVYVTGYTFSSNFPVSPGAYQTSNIGNYDAFVVKFDAAGSRQWASYLGGTFNDYAFGIAVDGSGNPYIVGETASQNFPNLNAFQANLSGSFDAFLTKFSSAGVLQWSTYIGGAGDDNGYAVAVDAAGNAAVAGETNSVNFPVSVSAFQTVQAGVGDVFVGVFTPSGLRQWLTYYGGTLGDIAKGVTYDAGGNLLITGGTASSNFPITAGAFQNTQRGYGDAFVVKMTGAGTRVWATYLGGSDYDVAFGIASDDSSRAIITGQTVSNDLPVGPTAYRGFRAGGDEAFLFVLNSSGARDWATYYGGNLDDIAYGVDADSHGNIAFGGYTYSPNFPVSASTIQGSKAGTADAFAVKFARNGTRIWATYHGGTGDEAAFATAMQYSGNVLLTGWTSSAGFPIAGSPFQSSYAGAVDAFVTKICDVKPIIAASGPTNLCAGGSVTLDAGPGYTSYLWSNSATSRTIIVTSAGKYAVMVTDGIGCSGVSDSVTVNVGPLLTASAGPPQAICLGSSVQIGTVPTGGVAPLRYHWTPPTGLSDTAIARPFASPAVTTKYFVTVTDAYNCSSIDSVEVTIYPNPSVDAGRDTLICAGASVTIGNPATGGKTPYTYAWSPASGLSSVSDSMPTATPASNRQYTVVVTDANGCQSTDQVWVRINTVVADPGVDWNICSGDTVQLGGSRTRGLGTLTYAWSPPTGLSSTTVAHPNAFPGTHTTYTLTVTDSLGCTDTENVDVFVFNSLTAFAGPDRSLCLGNGTTIGDTAVCGTAPYTFFWSPAAGLNDTSAQMPFAAPAITTQYILRVTDAALNVVYDTVMVTVNNPPTASAGPDAIICAGSGVVIGAVATGGSGPYTYRWTPATGLSSDDIATPTATPAVDTRYIVRVTDAVGCTDVDTVLIDISTLAVNAGLDRSICLGSNVTIGNAARGGMPFFNGYRYLWQPPTGLDSNNIARPKASPAVTTTYVVSVEDSMGCVVSDTIEVHVLPLPVADAGPNQTICRHESTQLGTLTTGSGGTPPYTYAWTPNTGFMSPTNTARPIVSPVLTQKYFVTVTDVNGCSNVDSVIVTVRPRLVFGPMPDTVTICRGDSVQIGAPVTGGSGTYRYSWQPTSNLSDSTSATPMARPFFRTRYIVTVIDSATGCTEKDTIVVGSIVRPSMLVTVGGATTFCEGDSVRLSVDPVRQYQGYAWYRDTTFIDTSRVIFAKQTGIYRVKVNTVLGCQGESQTVSILVVPLPRPRIIADGPLTFCEGGSVTFESDSAYLWTFRWSDGSIGRKKTITTSGDYFLTVTGPNGCVNNSPTFTVTVYPRPAPIIKALGSTVFCAGGSVELDADQAGAFKSYLWSTGATTRKITVTASGNYTVTVGDNNGCLGVSPPMQVVVHPLPTPTITPTGGSLTFCEGGKVTLEAPAGFPTYQWSNGGNTRTIEVSQPGTYTVTVWTAAGCQGTSAPVTVTVRPLPTPLISALGPTSFCVGDSVQLDAGAGYSGYQWSNGRRTRIITVKNNGSFSVTVTDPNGCRGTSAPVQVIVFAKPVPSITASGPLSFCPGDSVTLDAGAGYQSYQWSSGESTRSIVVKTSGTFSVTVTNDNNCTGTSASVAVTRYQTPQPVITANSALSFCEGGSVQLDAGSGWASYLWSTGAVTRRITVTQSGLYNVRVTNSNGCRGESPVVTVSVKANPIIPLITQFGNTLISTPAARYQWALSGAPISGATQRTYAPTRNGQYSVTVWNEDSCSATSALFDFRATGIDDVLPVAGFQVYPDPNQGLVTVDLLLAAPSPVRMVVTDMLGRVIMEFADEHASSMTRQLDLHNVPDGLYFLHVTAGKQTLLRKLLKQ